MISIQDANSIENIADWVELYSVFRFKPVSKAAILSEIERSSYNGDSAEMADSVIGELERRSRLYGSVSPFSIAGNIVTPLKKWSDVPELVMCLIFSLRGVIQKKGKDDGTKLFERLSREAIGSYLGGEARVVGFPAGKGLKSTICSIATEMGCVKISGVN